MRNKIIAAAAAALLFGGVGLAAAHTDNKPKQAEQPEVQILTHNEVITPKEEVTGFQIDPDTGRVTDVPVTPRSAPPVPDTPLPEEVK